MKDYCAAARNEDQASSIIGKEIEQLPRPWLPFPKEGRPKFDFTETDRRMVLTSNREVTVRRDGDDGAWLVLEFMPTRSTDMHLSNNGETRWQPYPDAKTDDEAYALATARATKDQRSHKAKVGAVRRRLCGRALEAAVNDGHDRAVRVVQEIARADNAAPSMIAVKLAVGMVVDFPRDLTDPDNHTFPMQAWERAALVSAYRAAVKSSGFDPVAEWQATPGI